MKKPNRDKDSDNREKNRSNKYSEDNRGFNYGDDITELKNKLQIECAKTANVSVIELAKDVLIGKYKIFDDIIPNDLNIYAMKSIQLEKYENYRDIRYYVKEYHAEVIVNSDEFNALVAEHEQTFQQF